MTTAWAHLPNAVHIDRVIASVLSDPMQWAETWVMVHGIGRVPVYSEAWSAAWLQITQDRDAVYNAARDAAWDGMPALGSAARAVARDASCKSVRDALLALIAYDDCAYMLDSDPGELAIIAKFGDPRASLLLPACKAFHSLKTNA